MDDLLEADFWPEIVSGITLDPGGIHKMT